MQYTNVQCKKKSFSDLEKLLLTGKMGSNEKERSAKKGEGNPHCAFGLDLRDDPRCDCGVLRLCAKK